MQRVKVTYRREAIDDLKAIYDHVEDVSQSPVTARRFVDRILKTCRNIGHAPQGGRPLL
ncbi:type II toxin-antitoxin system RelE/ParE family toxin [Amorphus sp. MBR-141]